MMSVITNDNGTNRAYKKAMEFTNQHIGTPDAFSKKVAQFVVDNFIVDGVLMRSEYDLFCFHILSQVNHNLALTGLILTKYEDEENTQVSA